MLGGEVFLDDGVVDGDNDASGDIIDVSMPRNERIKCDKRIARSVAGMI
jgi:hypothetical protein